MASFGQWRPHAPRNESSPGSQIVTDIYLANAGQVWQNCLDQSRPTLPDVGLHIYSQRWPMLSIFTHTHTLSACVRPPVLRNAYAANFDHLYICGRAIGASEGVGMPTGGPATHTRGGKHNGNTPELREASGPSPRGTTL